MKKIWIMSDLHLDGYRMPYRLPATPPDVDALVVAGDLCDGFLPMGIDWLASQLRGRDLPTILVAGNHDYYGSDDAPAYLRQAASRAARDGITLLGPTPSVEIAGVRFVGATLWTDFRLAHDFHVSIWWAKLGMPDYRSIDFGMRRLRPADTLDWHEKQLAAIGDELRRDFAGPSVVVTHHAPHPLSCWTPDVPAPSEASFVSDLTGFIELHKPDLWVHGHVHHRCDYEVGSTRVVCNPRGYLEERSDFDPSFVLEV